MRRLTVLLMAIFSYACNPVYSAQPVGEKPLNLTVDKDQWEGTWVHADGALTAMVTDAERGLLKVAWFENSKDTLQPKVYDLELRTFGKWTFANVKDPSQARYMLARIERKNRQVLLFLANTDRWKALVKARQIPGVLREIKSEGGGKPDIEVTVGPLLAKELAYITADERAALFNWSEPVALVKVTK